MSQQRRDWLRMGAALALGSALPLQVFGADDAPPFETLDLDWAGARRHPPRAASCKR